MTPERVTPMTDEGIRHFAELEVDLEIDDSPTVTFEFQVQPWTLRQILVTCGIWLTILAVCAVPWAALVWWIVR